MPRPLEFSKSEAVARAMELFWRKGYEATSIDDLSRFLGIGRASLYNAFGDKHGLLMEALAQYGDASCTALTSFMAEAGVSSGSCRPGIARGTSIWWAGLLRRTCRSPAMPCSRPMAGGPATVSSIFSPDGARLLYATYLGGTGDELIRGILIGNHGEVYLVGRTSSLDFPVTSNAVQRTYGGGDDAFIVKLERKGRLRARMVEGQFEVGLEGERGGRYSILASADLRVWAFWTNVSTTGSMVWLTAEEAPASGLGFFRAVTSRLTGFSVPARRSSPS